MRNLNILELNEFSHDYLFDIGRKYQFKSIQKLEQLHRINTLTKDKEEHKNLDPWVQWVSVHTGKESSEHGIYELGGAKNLKYDQIWDVLQKKGINCGIFGAMNTKYNLSSAPVFYLPDPWNVSEIARPKELNDLLALPRYYSNEYSAPKKIEIIKNFFLFLKFFIRNIKIFLNFNFYKSILFILKELRLSSISLFLILDYISTEVFFYYKNKFRTNFNIIFLNSIAHFQHHDWLEIDNRKAKAFFSIIDLIIKKFLDKDQDFIVTNAFSQDKIDKGDYYIYRQLNIQKLLDEINIKAIKVEQNMTNECYLYFENYEECKKTNDILATFKIGKENFYNSEIINDKCIFFKVAVHHKPKEKYMCNSEYNIKINLEDNYNLIKRTGSHSDKGILITNIGYDRKNISNHEIFNLIIQYFK